jgi:hypothetical protein
MFNYVVKVKKYYCPIKDAEFGHLKMFAHIKSLIK